MSCGFQPLTASDYFIRFQSPVRGLSLYYSEPKKCLQWGVQPSSCVCVLAIGIARETLTEDTTKHGCRLHAGSLRQGGGSVLAYARHFVALAGFPINCCKTPATLCTCFVLGLAGKVRSQFDRGDLPKTLAGAILLALDFEAMGPPGLAPLRRVPPRESSLVRWVPIGVGLTHRFSAPSHIPSPSSRVGCITLVLDPGPRPTHVLPPEPVHPPAPVRALSRSQSPVQAPSPLVLPPPLESPPPEGLPPL